jgi:hypothetical protein
LTHICGGFITYHLHSIPACCSARQVGDLASVPLSVRSIPCCTRKLYPLALLLACMRIPPCWKLMQVATPLLRFVSIANFCAYIDSRGIWYCQSPGRRLCMMNSACQPLSAVVVDVDTSDNRYFVDTGVRELKPWASNAVGWAFATGVAHGFKETGAALPLQL